MGNYSELLKDPRWQKKRLEILSRDNWQCRDCMNKEKTLHVHHMYYLKGRDPWEYENESLITLCLDCHEKCDNYRWQHAFMDLNLTPSQLLDFALMFKYLLNASEQKYKEDGAKYAMNPSWTYTSYFLEAFTPESLDDYYQTFRRPNFDKYHG